MVTHPLLKPKDSPLISEMSGIHSDQMLSWRETRFVEMGFADHEAQTLAATRIDLHDMDKLLQSGCPHDTAWQILTGTMFNGQDPLWRESDKGGYMATSEDPEEYDFVRDDDGA